MKQQTDAQFIGNINKYGCFFMVIVYWLKLVTENVEYGFNIINRFWMTAIESNIISGDMNGDGDMDDANELLIGDKDALLALAGIKLKYLGSFTPDKVVKKPGQFYIGEFYREWTEKGKKRSFTHFAGIDESFRCVYDPIENSQTVAKGTLKTVRVFGRI